MMARLQSAYKPLGLFAVWEDLDLVIKDFNQERKKHKQTSPFLLFSIVKLIFNAWLPVQPLILINFCFGQTRTWVQISLKAIIRRQTTD